MRGSTQRTKRWPKKGMQNYLTELLEWYRGEIAGEAFFSALAHRTEEPRQAAKWRTLARLEHFVAARLRPVLNARGVEIPAAEADVRRGQESALEYLNLPWQEALGRLRPYLDGYVREFQAAESRMPQDLQPLAQFVTAHERVLLEFVIREIEDGGRNSLHGARQLLGEATIDTPV